MYILVGNQGKAALFKDNKKDRKFIIQKKFSNDQFIKKESSIFSHRAGTESTSYTSNQTTLGECHFKENLVAKFCKEIVSYIENLKANNSLKSLVLICEPSMLGELRKKLSSELNYIIKNEYPKNFYTEKDHELTRYFHNLSAELSGR